MEIKEQETREAS